MKEVTNNSIIGHLAFNEDAYFYKCKSHLSNDKIQDLFNKLIGEEHTKVKVDEIIRNKIILDASHNKTEVIYSFLIFGFKTYPSFINFPEGQIPDTLVEYKIAYLVIVEINNYVVILKRNINKLTEFINSLVPIPSNTLTGSLINTNTKFKQMRLSSMSMNENSLRNKSYEANDLALVMPMFGSKYSIVNNAKFTNTDYTYSVNINTSHLSKTGTRKDITELFNWIYSLTLKLSRRTPKNPFLSRFASTVTWKEKYLDLEATSLLIDIHTLNNYIEALECKNICFKRNGVPIDVTESFAKYACHKIGKCIDLETVVKDSSYQPRDKRDRFGVKKLKSGIKITSRSHILDALYYKEDGEDKKLIDLINTIGCFSVGFSKHSYIYMGKRLYENSNINMDFEAIISILDPIIKPDQKVDSEKGNIKNYKENNASSFDKNTMFYIIEEKLKNDEKIKLIVCDDMGNEWADFISMEENKISYIHCKCNSNNDTRLSASDFQVVISQAIKNIGNINPDSKAIKKKKVQISKNWSDTNIAMCRRGNPDDYEKLHINLINNPNKTQEVCLAVNFLSKRKLTEAFNKIKKGRKLREKNSTIQLAWLLNGFISICKEANLNCRIFCRE